MSGRGYIGGGHIAAILDVSPFGTPLDAYYAITGELDMAPDAPKQSFFERRKEWEPYAFRCFERRTGIRIVRTNERYTDTQYPFFKAEIDFETEDDRNGELKTARQEVQWMWGTPGLEEPPMYVTAQALWGQMIKNRDHTYVHRFDLDEDGIYHVERDEGLIIDIRDRALSFWKRHIVPRRPPPPSNVEDVLKLYGKGTERAVEATPDIIDALDARADASTALKLADANKTIADTKIKLFMRDASVLTIRGKPVATWKANVNGVRTFRIK